MRSRTALVSAVALGVVLAVLVFVLATSDSAAERQPKSRLLGQQAPALGGPVLIGAGGAGGSDGDRVVTYDVPDAGGRWLLVNFFATDCIPCRLEHPDLVRFAAANADEARLVSVVYGDKAANVRAFFEEKGGAWPVIDDPDGAIAVRWGVVKVPESYLVAPNGTVVSKITGGIDYTRLQDLLVRAQRVVVSRRLAWLAAAVAVALALAIAVTDRDPRTDAERVDAIAATVACPACAGESARDSVARAAQIVRNEIATRVAAGESDDEIRAALADAYGETILLTPPRSGAASLVWVLPVAALVVALAGLAFTFRRWPAS